MPQNIQPVHLRIVCINPPADTWNGKLTEFGLQDKSGALTAGEPGADGALAFTCSVQTKPAEPVNFTGEFTHGTPKDRFLYLSLRQVDQREGWIKRLKIKLAGITWAQVQAAQGGVLAATVDGQGAATVKLIGGGWAVAKR